MAKYIQKSMAILDTEFVNGTEVRAIHPAWLDVAQQHLTAGLAWQISQWTNPQDDVWTGTIYVPLILRPWQSSISICLRAVLTHSAGTIDITLEEGGVPIQDMTVALTKDDISVVAVAPATQQDWAGIPLQGIGGLGYDVPPASGKGALTFAPTNAWRTVVVRVDLITARVRDLFFQCFCSADPLV